MKARNLLILIVGIALVGFASTAMAGWGGRGHMGPGWHHRGGYEGSGPYGAGGYGKGGCGYGADLTDEQIQQIENERKAFFDATKEIRQDLRDKRLQLRRELDSENLDREKVFQMQKEISDLRATLDQKRLEHRIAMQEISPDLGRGPYRGRGPGTGYERGGYGGGPGTGYGRGGYGGGPCWD